ncbi:MAG: hypothetical protein EOQ52_20345 [Mesorhizobium sp.]|uniref:hypothetical protein n=1 Tax=Mesorhizobium sp. TaxID=1871066 RepID=UPI000FE4F1E3|nr:hypothetical protein [Mesorhizobium sp.]RWB85904.1 MAG: hypothetical protein EOQ52_20345 [Mesorhizobium sp.]
MKAVLAAALLMVAAPASAQMSPSGCNALSDAASNAAEKMSGVIDQLGGDAFKNAMPVMPETSKAPAADVNNARIAAQMALQQYQHALRVFSASIHGCGT